MSRAVSTLEPVKDFPAITGSVAVERLVEADDLETLDEALEEITAAIALYSCELSQLHERRAALVSGKKEIRRRRARTELDRNYPPIVLLAIEATD
jgi:hypothetical protein